MPNNPTSICDGCEKHCVLAAREYITKKNNIYAPEINNLPVSHYYDTKRKERCATKSYPAYDMAYTAALKIADRCVHNQKNR